ARDARPLEARGAALSPEVEVRSDVGVVKAPTVPPVERAVRPALGTERDRGITVGNEPVLEVTRQRPDRPDVRVAVVGRSRRRANEAEAISRRPACVGGRLDPARASCVRKVDAGGAYARRERTGLVVPVV